MSLIDNKTDFEKVVILKILAEKQKAMIEELLTDNDEAVYIIKDLRQKLNDVQTVRWAKEEKAEYRKSEYYKQIKKEADVTRKKLHMSVIKNQNLTLQIIKLKGEKDIQKLG